MNRTQILIDKYLSSEMEAVSRDLDVIMDNQKDLTTDSVNRSAWYTERSGIS